MKIMSFAWTTEALLASAKTETRRDWKNGYAHKFHRGDLVAAYNRNPKFRGEQVATILLIEDPVRESLLDPLPAGAWEAEGIPWLLAHGIRRNKSLPTTEEEFRAWCREAQPWIVRFKLVEKVKATDEKEEKHGHQLRLF